MKRADTILQRFYNNYRPVVNPRGFMDGQPPAGSNWRIPGNTLYNPTPNRIYAVGDNGVARILNPFDRTPVDFGGANYVDEYKMMYGGEKIPVRDVPTLGKGGLTANKALEILHHGEVHGKKLTEKQRKFFGAMSKGNTMNYKKGGAYYDDGRDAWIYPDGTVGPNGPYKRKDGGGYGVFGYVPNRQLGGNALAMLRDYGGGISVPPLYKKY